MKHAIQLPDTCEHASLTGDPNGSTDHFAHA